MTIWRGLRPASRKIGRTPTQIHRHLNGVPSKKLQAALDAAGIIVDRNIHDAGDREIKK